jgi:predicted lipoprotein with Yx(FWY)xxD motif
VPGYGTVLATTHGSPLYLLTADPSGGSSCTGACASQWPPLTASGKPTAGPGTNQSLLSRFKRADGSVQVLYAEHALYTHPGTTATAVAGTASDGGIWYLVSPSGKPIKTTNGSGY